MIGKYAFSLNGDHYRGTFETREEAVREAFFAARNSETSPQTIYVGRMVQADPKADGHARSVISHMQARAREEFGDAGSQYLVGLNKPQIESLDNAIELAIRGWLSQNELLPTFFKIDAIGEYPVPTVSQNRGNNENREVHEIGSGDYGM
jgi:hypothetical protein